MTIINTREAQVRDFEHAQAVDKMILDRMARILRGLADGRDLEQRLMGRARTTLAWLDTTTYILPDDYEPIRSLIENAAMASGLMHPGDTICVGTMYDMMAQRDGFTREHQSNVVVKIQFGPVRV